MKTLYSMQYVRVATIMGSHCCFRLKPLICCFDQATYGKQAQRIGFYSDDASSVYLSFSLSWLTFFLLCLIQLRSTKVVVLLFPLRPELVELFSAKLKSRLVDYLTVVHLPIEPHQHMQFKNFKKLAYIHLHVCTCTLLRPRGTAFHIIIILIIISSKNK